LFYRIINIIFQNVPSGKAKHLNFTAKSK